MNRFGELLRYYRRKCNDPLRGGSLTQGRLGQILGEVLGDSGYSGVAVSDWERGKSQIDKDYRPVLIALLKVLLSNGGLQTLTEANTMLLSGNYRPLDENEKSLVFGDLLTNERGAGKPSRDSTLKLISEQLALWLVHLYSENSPEFMDKSQNWTGTCLNFLGNIFKRWNARRIFILFYWVVIWLLTWRLAFALMIWPFLDQNAAQLAVGKYIGGSLMVPVMIGLARNTKADPFWMAQQLEDSPKLRFYTYIGAFTGFHAGYMLIFIIALAGYYIGVRTLPNWINGLFAIIPVLVGYAAADQVPFNQWRAFGKLALRDGAIFSIFVLFGPLWGVYFLNYHQWLLLPMCGLPIILCGMVVIILLDRI